MMHQWKHHCCICICCFVAVWVS